MLSFRFKRIPPFSKKTAGTHFLGTTEKDTDEIEKVFGEAEYVNPEYPAEISIEFYNGVVASIYNHDRYGRSLWSIGGHKKIALAMVLMMLGEADKKEGIKIIFEGIKLG